MEFVKNNEIVLNLSSEACHQLSIENDWISFQARFGGIPRKILFPVSHVLAIYARENGQGMSFPFDGAPTPDPDDVQEKGSKGLIEKNTRPSLKVVK